MSIPAFTPETFYDDALDTLRSRLNIHGNAHVARFNLLDYEAAFDGATDDTAAWQAAMDDAEAAGGGIIDAPNNGEASKVTSVQVPGGVTIRGSVGGMGQDYGTRISGTTGYDTFTFAEGVETYGGVNFVGLNVSGGRRALYSPALSTHVTVRDSQFSGEEECILIEGNAEEWYLDNVRLTGGVDGFRVANELVFGTNFVDKCTFKDVLVNGQSRNGWRWEAQNSGSCTWINPIINSAGEHGFVVSGGITGWLFINANTENNGQDGSKARTTGTINSASASLVVASATGFSEGDDIVVQGAGADGVDLYSTIDTIAGTTFTLADTASTSVTSLAVTNATFDDFSITNSVSTPADITFVGGLIGGENTGNLRYSIDNPHGTSINLYGTRTLGDLPVYDPQFAVNGVATATVRQRSGLGFFSPRGLYVPNGLTGDYTWISAPRGGDLQFWLSTSSGTGGVGTMGEIQFRIHDANRTKVLYIDSSGNVIQSSGGGKLVALGGLGVGNSAAATSLGSVTKKIEVFDGSGASLGFVPVYDAIT